MSFRLFQPERAVPLPIATDDAEFSLEPGQFLVIELEAGHNQLCHGEVDNLFLAFVCDPSFFDSTTRVVEAGNDYWCGRLMEDVVELSPGAALRSVRRMNGAKLSFINPLRFPSVVRLTHEMSWPIT